MIIASDHLLETGKFRIKLAANRRVGGRFNTANMKDMGSEKRSQRHLGTSFEVLGDVD